MMKHLMTNILQARQASENNSLSEGGSFTTIEPFLPQATTSLSKLQTKLRDIT